MQKLNFQQVVETGLFSRAVTSFFLCSTLSMACIDIKGLAQGLEELPSTSELKRMSVADLMNIEVTSVSKRPEKLTEVASAIQVITNEDIRRSGATNLPEALRLSPNLQVAQLNSYAWIISARGFNGVFSNKLLVMIDGRTVYSPLFAGVYWDAQSVLLEDVDRIEVISGPGGTLWGANAVNGVINIITKKATNTHGLFASATGGSLLKQHHAIRYGGGIGSKFSYRVFAQYNSRGSTLGNKGENNPDSWYYSQTGFKADWNISEKDNISFQSNFYMGTEKTLPTESTLDGQNSMARWMHTFSEKSQMIVQSYYDRAWRRDIPSTISDELQTYDFDFQHQLLTGKNHTILWGLGYRLMQDKSQHSTSFVGFVPEQKNMDLFSAFVQDKIALTDNFNVTLGTKILHNVYSGFEWQPSIRLAYAATDRQTLWGAISRAVRTPSRIDVDYHIPTYQVPQGTPNVDGGPNFVSEKVIAYELGYRVQTSRSAHFSMATYYNQYDDIYTVEALAPPNSSTYQIQNGAKGYSWGAEFSGTYQIIERWRMKGGYTYFFKDIKNKPGHDFDPSQLDALGHDAQNRFLLQSFLNLPGNFELDVTARYVDRLQGFMPDYFTFDGRLAWMTKHWEVSIVGQNLMTERHREYQAQIPRSIYGKIACRF